MESRRSRAAAGLWGVPAACRACADRAGERGERGGERGSEEETTYCNGDVKKQKKRKKEEKVASNYSLRANVTPLNLQAKAEALSLWASS